MKKISLILLALAFACEAGAQNFNTGFFLDNYCYGSRINPALQYKSEYVGAIFSNILIGEYSNAGAKNFLFPNEGELVTGLHPSIAAGQFLSGLKADNTLGVSTDYTIYSQAVNKGKYRFVVEAVLKSYQQASLPYELFALAKNGSSDTPYNLARTRFDSRNYIEGSYTYSRKIIEGLTLGAKAKVMVGLAGASLKASTLDVTANAQQWGVDTDARLLMAAPFASMGSDKDSGNIFFKFDPRKLHPCGAGVGIDIGAVYTPVKGLMLSLSVLDIGCIWWCNNINARVAGSEEFSGGSNLNINDDSIPKEISEFLQKFGNAFSLNFDSPLWKAEGLPTSFNFGARYAMPFYDKLSVGIHVSLRSFARILNSDFRIGATVSPLEWLSLAANYGFGSNGGNIGVALTIGNKPVNFFIGGELYVGGTAKAAGTSVIPLGASRNIVNFGLNFTY